MSDRSAASSTSRHTENKPLSPFPRRWSQLPAGSSNSDPGVAKSPGNSPFGVRTQAVIDDVEQMLSRLSEAAENAEKELQQQEAGRPTDAEKVDPEEDLLPPVRPFLSHRRSAEALRPRPAAGPSRLDPARMSMFVTGSPSMLKQPESKTSLSDLFDERKARGESAFGHSKIQPESRNRSSDHVASPLRASLHAGQFTRDQDQTPTTTRLLRPRSTPPREETIGEHAREPLTPSKDLFGPRVRTKLPIQHTPRQSDDIVSVRSTRSDRPPLPPRSLSAASSSHASEGDSVSTASLECTSSQAGRDLEQALESLGSKASTSVGSLLSTVTSSSSNDREESTLAARNIPLPSSPARSRVGPTTSIPETQDLFSTPRRFDARSSSPQASPGTSFPAPARSWVRDPYIQRTLDNMGVSGPRRELLTPVEERTEKSKSWASENVISQAGE